MGVTRRAIPEGVDIIEARRWILRKMAPRAGMATKSELYDIWDYDPSLLDNALRNLRDLGIISYNGHFWYVVT